MHEARGLPDIERIFGGIKRHDLPERSYLGAQAGPGDSVRQRGR